MITLDNVSKLIRHKRGAIGSGTKILNSVNVTFPTSRRIAVLGHDEVAKSALIRMLAGISLPTTGRVIRHAKLSFPVGYVGGLSEELTVRQNVIHVAKVYQANVSEVVQFVQDVTRFGQDFDKPYANLSRIMRSELGTVLAYSIRFDVYLLDGAIAKGRPAFREKYSAIFEERIKTSGVIFATRDVRAVQKYCDMGAVIHKGSLRLYDRIDHALAAFKRVEPESFPAAVTVEDNDSSDEELFG